MVHKLPTPIANYFNADRVDGETVANCFTSDAVVKDEGQTFNGRAAIKKWKVDSSAKYSYSCEILKGEQQNDKVVVTCKLTGNFPGSPANLRYFFELKGEQISSLEIAP